MSTFRRVAPIVGLGLVVAVVVAIATRSPAHGAAETATARAPTLRERESITLAFPAFIRSAPVECVFMVIRVSSRDPDYALAYAQVLNWQRTGSRCRRYGANGFNVLRKTRGRWRFVYSGSDDPPCAARIPRHLVGCRP